MLRLSGRHDTLLLAGFAVAALTVFDRAIAQLISLAHEVETGYGVRLVPALVVLTALVIVQQHVKRRESREEAETAARAAAQAAERMRELERLHALGQRLASALTMEALQAALWRQMPVATQDRDAWITTLSRGQSEVLFDMGNTPVTTLEALTRQIADAVRDPGAQQPTGCARLDGWCCFPLLAGDGPIGVFGVSEHRVPIAAEEERALAAASAVLAIALRNVQLFTELRESAVTDSLTGCLNRAHMVDVLAAELRRSRRTGSPLSLLMVDLDGFKELNDTQGHIAGDAALAKVATRFRDVLRHSDVRCRYGGDEFLLLLPDTPIGGAIHVAENLRRHIEQLQIPAGESGEVVTASIGVATALSGETDAVAVIHRTDMALYQAKRAGRNRAAVYDPAYQEIKTLPVPAGPVLRKSA